MLTLEVIHCTVGASDNLGRKCRCYVPRGKRGRIRHHVGTKKNPIGLEFLSEIEKKNKKNSFIGSSIPPPIWGKIKKEGCDIYIYISCTFGNNTRFVPCVSCGESYQYIGTSVGGRRTSVVGALFFRRGVNQRLAIARKKYAPCSLRRRAVLAGAFWVSANKPRCLPLDLDVSHWMLAGRQDTT